MEIASQNMRFNAHSQVSRYPWIMPANLTPQYMEAERRFKQATSIEDKIAALEEMMAVMPKHKGTEKLQADLKSKLSALREQTTDTKKPASRGQHHAVERQGARQLALVGCPNSGKSQLVRALTHATPEVADYPFTTREPIPGMMRFENVGLQLVDLPPISPEYMESWVPQIIRNADAILWIVDLSDDDLLDRFEETNKLLQDSKIDLTRMRVLVVGNKADTGGAEERAAILQEICQGKFPMTKVSGTTASTEELEAFKRTVYDFLNVVRVYTKIPGRKAELNDPYVVDRGSTVLDVAAKVHRDFAQNLKYARIWGEGKANGVMVSRDFVVSEGDIVELHE
jgi:ribosome-interacting GTPase 1